MPGHNRQHYAGDHKRRAQRIVAAANANPTTRCLSPHCKYSNGTIADHPPGSTWDAGHVKDGQIGGPLQPEVAHCNRSAGALLGLARRIGLARTEDW